MRFDRQCTLLICWLDSVIAGGRKRPKIPILMYHSISEEPSTNRHPYFETATSPGRFKSQIESIVSSGFRIVSLAQAVKLLSNEEVYDRDSEPVSSEKQTKCVVITFDDGLEDFDKYAFPVLQKYDATPSVFLSTKFIGKNFLDGRPCLTALQIKKLSSQGVEFGSHTVSHPQLLNENLNRVESELSDSKKIIEDLIGKEVTQFSYPYKFPDTKPVFKADLRDLLVKTGYKVGVTTTIGCASVNADPLFLNRIPVNEHDDSSLYQAKLLGYYDWLYYIQRLKKSLI